jgi:hypothetical protein
VGAREKDPPVLDSDGVVECPSSRSLLAHGAMLGRKPGFMQRAGVEILEVRTRSSAPTGPRHGRRRQRPRPLNRTGGAAGRGCHYAQSGGHPDPANQVNVEESNQVAGAAGPIRLLTLSRVTCRSPAAVHRRGCARAFAPSRT